MVNQNTNVKKQDLIPVIEEKKLKPPVIYQIRDSEKALKELRSTLESQQEEIKKELLFEYPVVYIHNCPNKDYYEVYIGETSDIIKRTRQHFNNSCNNEKWQKMLLKENAELFIIGHEHFNKSLTLDIENRLMFYMLGVEKVRKIHNKRGNKQNKYYTSDEFYHIFSDVWMELRKKHAGLFPTENNIFESALYKASPFHELSDEQAQAKIKILNKVRKALKRKELGQLIFVSGEAGTGKTVLNSNLFYDLCTCSEELGLKNIKCKLMVNHEEQLTVYQQIAEKLCLNSDDKDIVCNPTHFILKYKEDDPIDVAFVDEAHLLWTRGKQAYRGKNQLEDIRKRARVVIAVFDQYQILRTDQYWEYNLLNQLEREARRQKNYIELTKQLRIHGSDEVVDWIHQFTKKQKIDRIPNDENYEIAIFDTPGQMHEVIIEKAKDEKFRLSRMISTFDWKYVQKKLPLYASYWEITIGNWKMPWNKQLPGDPKERKMNKKLAWAEQSHMINEVGSTFTIQGLDLNYAGVILGPSVKYRKGKVIFDPSCSANQNVKNARTLSDGSRQKFGEILIRNEVNVLMTRGVDGLYIYAYDEELRNALKKAKG